MTRLETGVQFGIAADSLTARDLTATPRHTASRERISTLLSSAHNKRQKYPGQKAAKSPLQERHLRTTSEYQRHSQFPVTAHKETAREMTLTRPVPYLGQYFIDSVDFRYAYSSQHLTHLSIRISHHNKTSNDRITTTVLRSHNIYTSSSILTARYHFSTSRRFHSNLILSTTVTRTKAFRYSARYFCPTENLEFLDRFSSQSPNIKFHGKPSNGIHADTRGHTDGRT